MVQEQVGSEMQEGLGQGLGWMPTYPGDNCCTLYANPNFGGSQRTECHNGSRREINLSGFNDDLDSWICGKKVKYDFCRHWVGQGCGGDWRIGGAGHISDPDLDRPNGNKAFHDQASSIWLEPYNGAPTAEGAGAITVFADSNCRGRSARLDWVDNFGAGGRYGADDIWQRGVRNDNIMSITVPYGYKAVLYKDDNLRGPSVELNGRYKNLRTLEMTCVDLSAEFGSDWSNVITSIEVQKIGDGAGAQGEWQEIITTEKQTYEIYVGMKAANERSTSQENKNTISLAMETSFKFMGAESKISIGSEFMHSTKKDVRDIMTHDVSQKIITTCTPEAGSGNGAGMYQWVVSTGGLEDYVSVWNRDYVCRTGANFRHEPECPPRFCVDAQCNTCTPQWEKEIAGKEENVEPFDTDEDIFGAVFDESTGEVTVVVDAESELLGKDLGDGLDTINSDKENRKDAGNALIASATALAFAAATLAF